MPQAGTSSWRRTAARREVTPIVRDGQVVALLEHRAEVLEQPDTVGEVVRAARLGLEHERLQAETRAQLADLTAARKRIVAAAADERQRSSATSTTAPSSS